MKATFYAPLQKVEEQDDGTLKVSGIASSEAVDAAGEVVTSEAMKAALPAFMSLGTGALREMHQLSAAGTVDKAEVDGDKTYITATVVDPVAISKVKTGTYKGFSIGGRVTKREKHVIKGLSLVEISLVDVPCCPTAVISMWKAAEGAAPLDAEAAFAELPAERRALALIKATHALGIMPANIVRALR